MKSEPVPPRIACSATEHGSRRLIHTSRVLFAHALCPRHDQVAYLDDAHDAQRVNDALGEFTMDESFE